MKKFIKNMYVDDATYNEMERICRCECCDTKSDAPEFDTEFDREIEFPNGLRMAIQVLGAGLGGRAWTQGILFDPEGYEIGCTNIGKAFGGEYRIDNWDKESYVVNVKKQTKMSPSDVLNNLHVMFQWMEQEGIDISDAWGQIGITSWNELYGFIEDARERAGVPRSVTIDNDKILSK